MSIKVEISSLENFAGPRASRSSSASLAFASPLTLPLSPAAGERENPSQRCLEGKTPESAKAQGFMSSFFGRWTTCCNHEAAAEDDYAVAQLRNRPPTRFMKSRDDCSGRGGLTFTLSPAAGERAGVRGIDAVTHRNAAETSEFLSRSALGAKVSAVSRNRVLKGEQS